MKVLISGANGLVATELTMLLLDNTDYELVLLSRDTAKLHGRYLRYSDRIKCFTLSQLTETKGYEPVDVCVHTAFSRSENGAELVESLEYTAKFARWAIQQHGVSVINISSQSVYGNNYTPFADEKSQCSPDYMYALGKYASELLCHEILDDSCVDLINIRLASVCENARFLKIFVSNAIHRLPINVVAPSQKVSFIDVRDVADALRCIIAHKSKIRGIFNLGTGQNHSILEIAQLVKNIAISKYHIKDVAIEIENNGADTQIGMDVNKFESTFNWRPKYSLEDMVESLFEMLTNVNGGGVSHLI